MFSLPTIQFDPQLLRKYDQPLPRYTSYPPATELKPEFEDVNFRAAIAIGNYKKTPLSLYCHIPFCETACYFCGCNTVITSRKELADPYIDYLIRNIHQVDALIDGDRPVHQLHWGGGTPNYLSLQQVERLWTALHDRFNFDPAAEISLEVNPRYLDREYVHFLRQLGFNRISFGIQDFNPVVQEAINRVQPKELLFNVMDWMREANFDSVNVDLIYGLPYQTLETFRETIRQTIALNPDRIAVFNFAYVPWLKPIQKRLPQEAMPQASEKLDILQMTIEELTSNGYVYIGMDHFAKPNDELAIAQREGQLHRNFQGYTTKPESDLVSFGMTSISMLHDVYVQNHKRLKDFYRAIDLDVLPIERGVSLSHEDIVRRTIIMELMCQFQLSKEALQEKYHLSFDQEFDDHFAGEQAALRQLEIDGLIEHTPNHIQVTPVGRLLIRNIAAVFDTFLKRRATTGFSKAI
ncbi:oxygen-independent coproporphyrinogen III oxidase [Oscillatoria sp. FACHB-1407]|uniref:oxygen-independent coproporphyrinogen III oxidase n=1 Tax=Oscillatoria sp. FACHB-1407 TaxID=2692847 RepID=UPI00168423BF|nr:oxygen-independent coproporphyrinogen III oxidase [Oscillatoria sp. FACHB-1407]MBD2464847.1 oxygen-independent coproporphyrinogen III oxidase [Oscillatoria sp. FACHB-1407]